MFESYTNLELPNYKPSNYFVGRKENMHSNINGLQGDKVNIPDGTYTGHQLVCSVKVKNNEGITYEFDSSICIKCTFPVPCIVTVKDGIAKIFTK